MAGSVQPGWYSDPFDPQSVRWWNGAAWTEHQQAKPSRASEQNRGPQRRATDVPEWGTRDAGHSRGVPNAHRKGLLYGLGAVGVACALVGVGLAVSQSPNPPSLPLAAAPSTVATPTPTSSTTPFRSADPGDEVQEEVGRKVTNIEFCILLEPVVNTATRMTSAHSWSVDERYFRRVAQFSKSLDALEWATERNELTKEQRAYLTILHTIKRVAKRQMLVPEGGAQYNGELLTQLDLLTFSLPDYCDPDGLYGG